MAGSAGLTRPPDFSGKSEPWFANRGRPKRQVVFNRGHGIFYASCACRNIALDCSLEFVAWDVIDAQRRVALALGEAGFIRGLRAGKREGDLPACFPSCRVDLSQQFAAAIHRSGGRPACALRCRGLSATNGRVHSTPAGRALFQMLGVFAEFERSMMRSRVKAGLARARLHGTKSGKPIGQKPLARHKVEMILAELQKGTGIIKTARLVRTGVSAVQRIKAAMAA